MAKTAKFSLKLLVDEEKNKVVLAEAGQDFVDVLFSLLTLPMGTIARLLEKHQKLPQTLGCYKNLNQSVANLGVDNFETEACKSMLMHPKSVEEIRCRRLKLNMDTEPSNFFVCPNFYKNGSCRSYSNFCCSKCGCGNSMSKQVQVPEEVQAGRRIGNAVDGVFVTCRSSFIVTDDLRVTLNSIGAIVDVLKDLGYPGFSDMQEMILEVGFEEVLVLLGCLVTTHAPLTYAFLRKDMMICTDKILSPLVREIGHVDPDKVFHVEVFVRKLDRKILYAESSEDFVDSLLTFLVLPLELACSFVDDNTILECVRNLRSSVCRRASCSNFVELPDYYYACRNRLLLLRTSPSPEFLSSIPKDSKYWSDFKFTHLVVSFMRHRDDVIVYPNNPKYKSGTTTSSDGFLRRCTKFIVSDDLFITPMNSSSTIGLLKKMQVDISDLEQHQISISKAELISILRASLISSSALTNGLSNLLTKKSKEET